MNKVELIESLKEKYKIESIETAINFIQEIVAEATRKYNDCAETLDGIKNTMKAWGVK